MKIISSILESQSYPCTATIGFFDGVHLGHQHLIEEVKKCAQENHQKSLLITFKEHPLKTIKPDIKPQLLTTFEERIHLLGECGVDFCFPMDFSREIAQMTAENFMREYLQQKLNVKNLVVGYDHHFGSDKLPFEDCKHIGLQLGITVRQAQKYFQDDVPNICSSTIRRVIIDGEVEKFNQLTGRRYSISGMVVTGKQIGRKLGFPTANIMPENPDKIVPSCGVYAVSVKVSNKYFKGMANIGNRPTVEENGATTFEVHILDFNSIIYNQPITIEFHKRLRLEKRFDSLVELQSALQNDMLDVEKYFASLP